LSRMIRIAMAQINPTLGDLKGNSTKIVEFVRNAKEKGADLVVFPELSITGYSPMDLLYDSGFVSENERYLKLVAGTMPEDIVAIVGFADPTPEGLRNGAAILRKGRILDKRHKTLLPNYDVFDEKRYFVPADENLPVWLEIGGTKVSLGLEICEDLWDTNNPVKVTDRLVAAGAELIVNISASPFESNKRDVRKHLILEKVNRLKKPFMLVNLIGGQDEMVFDGNSLAFDSDSNLIAWGGEFAESLTVFDLDLEKGTGKPIPLPGVRREASIFNALVLGVKDYFRKTACRRAVLGLSGGIDSALVAVIATSALGAENLTCISMPSKFTARMSIDDARLLCDRLHVKYLEIPIDPVAKIYDESLQGIFAGMKRNIAEENIQSRIRGNLLMAIANKFDSYLLSTGNKTELALGYCTMYGDMCGALAVISDLSKSDVYALARFINETRDDLIPKRIYDRIPTAELAEGQFDPFDYEIVSPLVDSIINDQLSKTELIKLGYEKSLVDDIFRKIKNAEFKRHQAAPGIKITGKAFGVGRRYPIINHFEEI